MRVFATVVLCVVAGLGFGTFVHGRRTEVKHVSREEMLKRGAQATAAASAVQDSVRIGDQKVRVSRVLCSNAPTATWTCAVRFRSVSGDELTGPNAPGVEVTFMGRSTVQLRKCRLVSPEQGLDVDCAKRADIAVPGD